MFVLDTSMTLAWVFTDEHSGMTDAVLGRLETEPAIAPGIWPLEVANGLRTAERRGRLDLADAAHIRALLLALPVEIEAVDLELALGEVSEMARTLELTAYDAAYLALAARRGLPLATIDDRLRQAATKAGVELV